MKTILPRHTIPISQVHSVLGGCHRQGLDVDALLGQAGISPSLLSSPLSRVSQLHFAKLLRVVQRRTGDEYWGLCSHPVRPGTFAQCCELMVHAPTLGDALRAGSHFYHLVLQDFTVRIQQKDGVAWVRLQSHVPVGECSDFAERVFMLFSYGVMCWMVEERIPISQVLMRGKALSDQATTSLLFNGPVLYEQSCSGFSFDVSWLDCALRQDRSSLHGFLRRSLGNLLVRYRDRSHIVERVRCYLRQNLTHGSVPLEQVADALAMPAYTLRRRLRMEQERFQDLKDDLRRDAAIDYLACPNLSLTEVAERLGFSEPSTFHRAFKKWTGLPPGEYREAVLADDPPLVVGQ
ncbi:AraC family transcriptional regulator [Marinobacter sp. ANT_B65]|uniref:AraC family transcriptional regulator n=1 Tax=Marinobacter sp. ANT_B65 TaxID=2039467 RepID=UPI000BBEE744|nr:AraC family transcriptional regulator [Marinobacter sp. ANT_B65]PCM43262.1 AraC family transcriptional regulator [Marinobacter sp. ANT_B65]